MDRDASYVAVGAFVLLVVALAAGFVLWYSDSGDAGRQSRYEIYFQGSVAGLSEGSAVRYLGVAVGRVARIGLDPRDPGRVRVVADIADSTPVAEDTVARLSLQGVTGLLYIDLAPLPPGMRPPARVEGLEHPVIASAQSQFDVLVGNLPEVVARAGEALNRINALLSDDNLASAGEVVANAERVAADLPATVEEARAMFRDLRAAAMEIQGTAAALRELTGESGEQVRAAAVRLREVADTVAGTAARLDRLVADNEAHVDRFAAGGLGEFEQLVREAREAVRSVDALADSLQRDPSQLLYRPAPAGVEIPQ